MLEKVEFKATRMVPPFIRKTMGFMDRISGTLSSKIALQLFLTPIRFKVPKRELSFLENAKKFSINFSGRRIQMYQWGDGTPELLLIHGWCGRGSQLGAIAQQFEAMGKTVLAFDGPAHGKSSGKQTNLVQFSELIAQLKQDYPSLRYGIGHSMGAAATAHSVVQGTALQKIVMISSPSSTPDIIEDFARQINIAAKSGDKIRRALERKFNKSVETTSAGVIAKELQIEGLVIHDQNDPDVPVSSAYDIAKAWPLAKLHLTERMGHRKLLYDKTLIEKIQSFLYP